jgi:hypothetical protein
MNKEFIPYEQALEFKELGFNEQCMFPYHRNNTEYIDSAHVELVNYNATEKLVSAVLYQQAFRWFREKYDFRYSIGKTNISVIHYLGTTQLLQDNATYEDAELATIKWFIGVAKQK